MTFHNLSFSEQFLIWAIRKWFDAYVNNSNAYNILRDAFRLARISSAFPLFDSLMTILALSNKVTINIETTDHQALSFDEIQILNIIAQFQQNNNKEPISKIFSLWLPLNAQQTGPHLGQELSQVLLEAGHKFPVRQFETNISNATKTKKNIQPSITLS